MHYSHTKNDHLLDAALVLATTGKPVQMRITNIKGDSQYVVGVIGGAYQGKTAERTTVSFTHTTIAVEVSDDWDIVTHDRSDEPPAPPKPDGTINVSVVRWREGRVLGFHDATIVKRVTHEAMLVRYALDGHTAAVFYSEIRATPEGWEAIKQIA